MPQQRCIIEIGKTLEINGVGTRPTTVKGLINIDAPFYQGGKDGRGPALTNDRAQRLAAALEVAIEKAILDFINKEH